MTHCETASAWFNARLFYTRGKRMKFYLDGFDQPETYEITRIVEAYGGEFTEPAEDVLVFCKQYRTDNKYGTTVSAKFLYDCVMRNKQQDLEKYILSGEPLVENKGTNGKWFYNPETSDVNNNKPTRNGNNVKRVVKSAGTRAPHMIQDKTRERQIKIKCENCHEIMPNFTLVECLDFEADYSNTKQETLTDPEIRDFACTTRRGFRKEQQSQSKNRRPLDKHIMPVQAKVEKERYNYVISVEMKD